MTTAILLQSDVLANVDISSPTLIGSYTADANRMLMIQLFLDQVVGGGIYTFYARIQLGGVGSIYTILPKTSATAAGGETSIAAQSIIVSARIGDVVEVFVQGLPADVLIDSVVRWFELSEQLYAGAIAFTYTLTDTVTFLPIEGAEVWFTTDAGGINVVWKGDSDAFGVARDTNGQLPMLDNGTYYVWRQHADYTFVNPDTELVSP